MPAVEPYSIDERFLDLDGLGEGLTELSCRIRAAVRHIAKIPTCIGIGPTKTIAKLANKVAKKDRDGSGVCDFALPEVREAAYRTIPVSDVWGLGPAAQAKLKGAGVSTVAEFLAYPADDLRGLLSVTGLRTQRELMGIACFPFGTVPATRKSLAVTRSFGRAITAWPDMREAVATYTARAAEKLRGYRMVASAVQVFMHTNRFNGDPHYASHGTVTLEPSNDSFFLINATVRVAHRLWREGFRYAKAGVVFIDLCPVEQASAEFFPSRDPLHSEALMKVLDTVNRRYGRDTLRPEEPARGRTGRCAVRSYLRPIRRALTICSRRPRRSYSARHFFYVVRSVGGCCRWLARSRRGRGRWRWADRGSRGPRRRP